MGQALKRFVAILFQSLTNRENEHGSQGLLRGFGYSSLGYGSSLYR